MSGSIRSISWGGPPGKGGPDREHFRGAMPATCSYEVFLAALYLLSSLPASSIDESGRAILIPFCLSRHPSPSSLRRISVRMGCMTIRVTRELIEELEAAAEERYKRDKEQVNALRSLLERYEAGDLPGEVLAKMGGRDESATAPDRTADLRRPQTLRSKVTEVCQNHPDREWTARDLLSYLKSVGFPVRERTLGSVSGCLWQLAREKKLAVVKRGVGSSPSIYRWRPDDRTASAHQESDE